MAEEVSMPDRRSLIRMFPLFRLVGAIRQAFDLRKLIIAAVGLAILQPGRSLLDRLVAPSADTTPALISSWPMVLSRSEPRPWYGEIVAGLHTRISEPFRLVATPVLALVNPRGDWWAVFHALSSLLWLFVVWGICGGAIARIAIVQIAVPRQMTIVEALRFAQANARPLIMAPVCPVLGVAFCGVIGALFGLFYRLPVIGSTLAGITLLVPLAVGLVMTLLLGGLLGGWPLLQAATAGGAEDTLDALSRVFGYLNQRLGSFIVVVALAYLAGMLGLVFVDLFTAAVIRLTQWSLSLSAGSGPTDLFFDSPATLPEGIAGASHAFWLRLVRLLAHGWIFSFYWTAAANLYLWLRHDIDGTPWTAIDPAVSPAGPSR